MIARFFNRLAASRLSKRGHEKARNRIVERTKQMRRELGLPEDRRLT